MNHGYRPIGEVELRELFDELSNWGRWGEQDQLGTLNYAMGPEARAIVAQAVGTGQTLGLSRPLSASYTKANRVPMLHHMISSGAEAGTGGHGMSDWFGIAPHGFGVTHIDALNHMAWDGMLYNGIPAATVRTTRGGSHASVDALRNGAFGRGVLLDVPLALGVDWLELGEAIRPEHLEASQAHHGLEVGPGDFLFIRTGRDAREAVHGAMDYWVDGAPGLDATCARWLHERNVSLLATDIGGDVIPAKSEQSGGVSFPLHILCLVSMGMWMIDSAYLEELAQLCEAQRRWSFGTVLSTVRIKNATGAPVNPIAIL